MSAPERSLRGGMLLRLLRFRPRLVVIAAVFGFLAGVAQFYQRDTGFSSLLSIGDILDRTKVSGLRQVPHYVYEDSAGYDGAYYVQLALNPTLANPELAQAIDNLPYRAKRILMSWVAWTVGLGQPAWIVQVHALINVACWLALAWVLLGWFPPTTWDNVLRWAAVLFSHGMCMSVRHSLVDGPSLLLVALAMRGFETGRPRAGGIALALAGLGKETGLLACAGLDFDWRSPRTWARAAGRALAIALPLLAWMAYVRLRFGPAEDPGMGNFTWPLAGLGEKFGFVLRELVGREATAISWATLAVLVALVVQGTFFAARWRPAERWWRIGAAFAVMMMFLSTPVWEGYPGASTRVLLPMTLAFNLLVPRGARWLPVLLAGNLTVAASFFEYSPPTEFYRVEGDAVVRRAVQVIPAQGWHGPELDAKHRWRWTSGRAELKLVNQSGGPLRVTMRGEASSVEGSRSLRVSLGERLLWGGTIESRQAVALRFGFVLPPGETVLIFSTDRPGRKMGGDPRELSFQVADLEIVVAP
jgi:hypothetical protein